jgi:hypothetical protein
MAIVAELAMAKRKPSEAKPTGRPPKPTGSPTQVRMDPDIASMAKVVASVEGISMTELLSGILRPILSERTKLAGRKLMEDRK